MKIFRHIYIFLSITVIFSGCISEFDPPSQDYENLLVVEAFLTNDGEPFEVILSRSTPIDTIAFIPESGANISLETEIGESYELFEYQAGKYQSFANIDPQIGQDYKLRLRTSNGRSYESEYVNMRNTPEIDSVTFRYEEKPTAGLQGMQIYVTTHDPANNTWYYRWEWDETWIFYTPIAGTHIYDNGQILVREENINRCWKEFGSSSIEISTSKNLTEDVISDYPLLYVSSETDRLGNRYSLNVKQFALSEASYNYWLELEKVTESLGTLFDPQPSTIYSNIQNINDEDEIVLGYFDASSVSEERIFINRRDLPLIRVPNYYVNCVDTIVSRGLVPEMILRGYMLGYETNNEFGIPIYVMSDPWCIDCTLVGTNVIPDFW
jgi:hypothetical protein